jgi:hypothetical protein
LFAFSFLTIGKIDFSKFELDAEDGKFLAFQLGQTLGLIHGKELYTKKQIGEAFPSLQPFLERNASPSDRDALNELKAKLIESFEGIVLKSKGNFVMFTSNVELKHENLLQQQSRGTSACFWKEM